tara:strand:- start:4711 stop:5343 length:633 start_codon:yes stop_codon:yes gene_type:complete
MTTIIDYGIGNVFSVKRSLEQCGDKNVNLSADPDEIIKADRLILPGVGAFHHGMDGLKERNLIEPIVSVINQGKPFLGICLGMQMLVTSSQEFGINKGLNVIEGEVVPIVDETNIKKLKIPYIGWAKLNINKRSDGKVSALENLSAESFVYLVHSFHVKTKNEVDTSATYNYDDLKVTAAIEKDNIIGFQFHPEKSGNIGLELIKKFLSL